MNVSRIAVIISIYMLWFAYVESVAAIDLDWEKLENGEVITSVEPLPCFGEGVKKRVVGVVLINAPLESVWEVLCEWEQMGEYVDNLSYYKILQSKGDDHLIQGRIRAVGFKVDYPLMVHFDHKHKKQTWRLVSESEFKKFEAEGVHGLIEPHPLLKSVGGDEMLESLGEKTLYTYAPILESKLPIPSWIENYAARLTLPKYVLAIKKRVESGKKYKK